MQNRTALSTKPDILPSRNDVVSHLATIDEMSQHIATMVPMQVLADIDNSRNPMQLSKDRLERAATENQFMNGKIAAITVSVIPHSIMVYD